MIWVDTFNLFHLSNLGFRKTVIHSSNPLSILYVLSKEHALCKTLFSKFTCSIILG